MMEGGETASENLPSRPGAPRVTLRLTWPETLLLVVLAAVQFTHIVDFVLIMPLGPRMTADLHLSLEQFSFVVAAYAFSAAAAGLLAAFVMDRFNRKRLLTVLFSGFTLGTGLCALAPNYPLLLMGRVVAGAFGGVGASLTLTIVGDAFPESRRGTAMGVLMTAFSVASVIGVPIGLAIAQLVGMWQAPFAALVGIGVGVLILIQMVLPSLPRPADSDRPDDPLKILQEFLAVLLRPGHLLAYAFMTALVMASFTLQPALPTYVVKNVGVNETYLEWIYICGGAATLFTQTYVGRLSDRLGKRPVFRVLALFTIVPILLITNLPGGLPFPWNLAATLAATTLFMTTTAGRMVPAMALITASAEPRVRGAFMSINSAVQQGALALAALAAGALMGETETKALTGYATVGWFCAGVTLLTVAMVALLRPAPHGEEAVVVVDAAAAEPASDEIRPAETGLVLPRPPLASPEAVRAAAD